MYHLLLTDGSMLHGMVNRTMSLYVLTIPLYLLFIFRHLWPMYLI